MRGPHGLPVIGKNAGHSAPMIGDGISANQPSGAAPAVPDAPTAISPDLGDTGGGTFVTITVADSTGLTGAKIDGTAVTSFAIVDGTHVSGRTPAKASGTYDVVVSNASGDSNALAAAFESWAPDDAATALAVWYDPSDAANRTIVSGKFSAIADKSGNARNGSQGTPGARITLGTGRFGAFDSFRCLAADGSRLDTGDWTAITGCEMLVLRKLDSANSDGQWHFLCGPAATASFVPLGSVDDLVYDAFGATARKSTGVDPGDFTVAHVYGVVSETLDWRAYWNGTQFFSTAVNTVGFHSFGEFGSDVSGTTCDQDIGPFLLYAAELSASDRAKAVKWLQGRAV